LEVGEDVVGQREEDVVDLREEARVGVGRGGDGGGGGGGAWVVERSGAVKTA